MFKKILAFALALLMAASMAACKPNNENPGTTDPGTETPGTTDPGTETPGTTDPGTETPGTTDPGTETPGTTDPGTETPADPDAGMTAVNEEIYATVTVDLRTSPEIDEDNVVGVLRYGQRATRIKVGAVWSKIVYDKVEYYVASNCIAQYNSSVVLPGDVPVTPVEGEIVCVVTGKLNLRSEPKVAEGNVKVQVEFGTLMNFIKVAEQDEEWYLVEYGGSQYYANSEYLYHIAQYEEWAAPKTMYVAVDQIWVRYYPEMDDEAQFRVIYKGQALQVQALSEDKVWARVEIDGRSYFVGYKNLTEKNPAEPDSDAGNTEEGGK